MRAGTKNKNIHFSSIVMFDDFMKTRQNLAKIQAKFLVMFGEGPGISERKEDPNPIKCIFGSECSFSFSNCGFCQIQYLEST